jgi:serine/threonine-protein kinase
MTLGGRYRLEERIAAGGMATVWRAHDDVLDRTVAVKVLTEALADDPAYVARLEREARVAAGLMHPNLVRIFDFGAGGERPHLVMEYVDGQTLADRMGSQGAPPVDGERLATELLGALDHVHRAGVVHRDVKPSNILIEPGGRARLADLGIARARDAASITETGNVIGTLRYMAPEVLEGQLATERSDLYSAGIVLREAAQPARGTALDLLVDRLTAPDPAGRPASAAAALGDLGRAGRATAVTAVAPSHRQIEVTPARALSALAIAALAAVLAVAALGGGGGTEKRPAGDRRAQAPPTRATTTTSTTTVTTASAAPASAQPSCSDLEAKRSALDARRARIEKALQGDKTALEGVKARFEERKHALDERLKACAKPAPAPPPAPSGEGD